tara:strand:+ start:405 stop:794 length:390 start_codon:yes stop_codon:yes gene_type:complete
MLLGNFLVGYPPRAFSKDKGAESPRPASREDVYLYRGLGASYFCNARVSKVDFPKAIGIAAATYVQVLNGRHNGYVASVGSEKLTNKQLYNGAEFQILNAALEYCPKEVPKNVKKRIENAIKKQKKANK